MLPTFSSERMRGLVPKAFKIACLLAVLLVTSFARAEWQDPLKSPSIKTERAHKSLLLDITRADTRLVAVGAHGHIIYSDDNGINWTQSTVPVSVTLTKVFFVSGQIGWAVGHDSVILKSTDGGVNWQLQFDGFKANQAIVDGAEHSVEKAQANLVKALENNNQNAIDRAEEKLEALGYVLDDATYDNKVGSTKPFLDIWFYDAHQGYAVGAYGMMFYTNDGGKNWINGVSRIPNPDRFHLNSITMVGSNALMMVGEQGLIVRSDDLGKNWFVQDTPYQGSFFGLVAKDDQQLLYGLRGHVYYTKNGGLSWVELQTGSEQTLLGGVVGKRQTMLVGSAGIVLIFDRDMKQTQVFTLVGRKDNSAIVEAVDGTFVLVGEAGVMRVKANGQISSDVISMVGGE